MGGRSVLVTAAEERTLAPVRDAVEQQAPSSLPERRDLFLCHAWDDRLGAAKELHDHLETLGVWVWFSEKDVGLGKPLLRAIDKGLGNSRAGIVLVTPALLKSLQAGSLTRNSPCCSRPTASSPWPTTRRSKLSGTSAPCLPRVLD